VSRRASTKQSTINYQRLAPHSPQAEEDQHFLSTPLGEGDSGAEASSVGHSISVPVAPVSSPAMLPSTAGLCFALRGRSSDFNFLSCPLSFLLMKLPFTLGVVGHFGLAVRDPKKSAQWFQRALGLRKEFEFEDGIAVGNENVTIVLFKGKPSPETLGHMSFHLPDMATLRKALDHLKKHDVDLEDPDDEIGPEAPGSPHMGIWFHDLDGYRWELSVQGGK
jgi:catechol 2,3-dioxygenase-like lactoylglutathione lyase family enzyme